MNEHFLIGFEKAAKEMTDKERHRAILNAGSTLGSWAAKGLGAYSLYKALPESAKTPLKAGFGGYVVGDLLGTAAGTLAATLLLRKKKKKKD